MARRVEEGSEGRRPMRRWRDAFRGSGHRAVPGGSALGAGRVRAGGVRKVQALADQVAFGVLALPTRTSEATFFFSQRVGEFELFCLQRELLSLPRLLDHVGRPLLASGPYVGRCLSQALRVDSKLGEGPSQERFRHATECD